MVTRRMLLSSTAVAAVAVALAGCGGSSTGGGLSGVQVYVDVVMNGLSVIANSLGGFGLSAATIARIASYVTQAAGLASAILAAVNPSGALITNFASVAHAILQSLTSATGVTIPTWLLTIIADVASVLPLIAPLLLATRSANDPKAAVARLGALQHWR